MEKVKVMQYKDYNHLLGRAVKIHLKCGGSFFFKITGCKQMDETFLTGFDDEGLNITINIKDIDYINI